MFTTALPNEDGCKTANLRWPSTFGKRSLRLQERLTMPDKGSFSLIVSAAMRE